MDNPHIIDKIRTLLDEVYAEGIAAGRRLGREEVVALIQNAPLKNGHARTRAPRGPRTQPPHPDTMPSPATPEPPAMHAAPPPHASVSKAEEPASLDAVVDLALKEMDAPDGVDPTALTSFIKSAANGHGDITVQDVRGVLRQKTMTGEVRRVGRGRYVATAQPPQPGMF